MQTIKRKATPTILKNKNFQTIMIKVLFPYEEKQKDLANIELLPRMLNYMNNCYKTEEEFQIAKKQNYILGISCTNSIIGTTGCFTFNLIIPDTKTLRKNILEDQFKFFHEMIYNPLIIKNGFSPFELEREKKNLQIGIESTMKNMRSYQNLRLKEIIDDQGVLSRNLIRNQNLIKKVTPENLYQYYQKTIKENQPTIYIMGNVNEEEMINLCNKYIYQKRWKDKTLKGNLNYFLKPKNEVTRIEENEAFKDSSLSIVYKIKDYQKEDTIYLNIIKDLLTSLSSRLLSEELRNQKDLVYSTKVTAYPHYACFEITAYINKKSKYEVEKTILDVIQKLKNSNEITPLLENLKERKRQNLLRKLDDKYLILEDFILKDLEIDITLEEYYEQYKKVTPKDISLFIDRFILDTIYFLEEDSHE